MKEKSRRQFIKSFFYLAISAMGFAFISLCAGCKKKVKLISLNNITDRKNKGRFINNGTNEILPDFEPAYLKLHRSGELKKRGEELWNIMKSCKLCPRMCGVNKLVGNKGFCQASHN